MTGISVGGVVAWDEPKNIPREALCEELSGIGPAALEDRSKRLDIPHKVRGILRPISYMLARKLP